MPAFLLLSSAPLPLSSQSLRLTPLPLHRESSQAPTSTSGFPQLHSQPPMAIADKVVPSPRIRVSMAIADAFMCLSFATLWFFFGAFATMVFWERTCGEDCTAFHVWKLVAFLFACSSAYSVVLYMLPKIRPDSNTEEPEKELRPRTVLGDSAFLGIHVLEVFVLRVAVGDMLKTFLLLKGSPMERVVFAILDGGSVGFQFLYCFVIIPTLALRTRKMSRIRHGLDEEKGGMKNGLTRWVRKLQSLLSSMADPCC